MITKSTPSALLVLILLSGSVSALAQVGTNTGAANPTRTYVVRPVGIGSKLSVKVRSTRQIQVQVTDENDNPVPDLPIIFALTTTGGKSLGMLGPAGGSGASSGVAGASSLTTTTNAQGIASADFIAGESSGTGTLSARVEGTDFAWTQEIKVKKSGFWTTRNTLLVLAAAAAAGTAVAIATNGSDDKRPQPQQNDGFDGSNTNRRDHKPPKDRRDPRRR